MGGLLQSIAPILETVCIACALGLSQYIALRAGLFSLATAGLACVGAYLFAILFQGFGVPPAIGFLAAGIAGGLCGLLLALPLARLRGPYQAMATIAFVEIVIAVVFQWESVTGGAAGLNGIPKVFNLAHLVIFVGVTMAFCALLRQTGIGRAFDAVAQDETVAASLGISAARCHVIGFILSGAFAGFTGALVAGTTYSIAPEQFGTPMLVLAISAVVLGGRNSIWGPVVGAAVLVLVPEIARPLAESRYILHGLLLCVVIIYLPLGLVDTAKSILARRRPAPECAPAGPLLKATGP